MLKAEGLWFRYGRKEPWVVEDADLSIAPGEVVGLWGPSGCGKSTAARLAAGLLRPERGAVTVDGRPLISAPGPLPVQMLVQHPEGAMNPRWRVRDVLAEGRGPSAETLTSNELIDLLPIGLVEPLWMDRFPHEISGGELQRVNLGRALLSSPAYLIADEITSSLDAITQARLWKHLLALAAGSDEQPGLGILAISHDLPLLGEIADRVMDASAVLDISKRAVDR